MENISIKHFSDKPLKERLKKNPNEVKKFIDAIVKEYERDKDLDSLLAVLQIVVGIKRGGCCQFAKFSVFRSILNACGLDIVLVRSVV
jgi:tRNA-binding EMAP/Myf-like protein